MRIFLSYAHDDDDYFRLFKQGLDSRIKKHNWQLWDDQSILPGEIWHDVIQDKVADCECAVLLLSSGFFASHYIENEELKKFLERQEREGVLIVPVEVRPCQFEEHPELRKRQVFRPPGKEFGQPDRTHITFGEVLRENQHRQLVGCPASDRFLDDFVSKLKAAADRQAAKRTPEKSASRSVEPDFSPAVEIQNAGRIIRGMEVFMPQPAYLDEFVMGYEGFKMSTAMLSTRSSEQDLARTSQMGNLLTERLLDDVAALREKIYDSDHLRKLYPKVHFEEIVFPEKLGHNTLETITEKRQQRHRFPWHERSLIVSALTLRLLHTLDEKAAYHLLDFVRDREPQVWKKALTGLVMAYVQREQQPDFVPPEHLRHDLAILREDPDVAQALLEITEHLARPETEQELWDKHIGKVKFDEKFQFFQQMPHWLLPFYPDNPVLSEHIADPELRNLLLQTNEWRPDALKYAFCLNYRQLSPEERKSTVEELRQSRADETRYAFIRHLYPGLDKAEALRRSSEVPDAIRQIRFFLRYFSGDAFRDIVLEKVPLYHSSLGQLLLSERWLTKLRALWLYLEDKYEEAIPCFLQVLAQEPEHPFFLSRLGRMYWASKQYDEAIEQLEKVLVGYPEETWVLGMIARCYRQKEDYEQELPYRQRVAELEPEAAENWGMVGSTLGLLKRYDEAIEQHKKAEAIDPNLVWNLRGLAICYRKKKDYEQELSYRQRVAELEPKNAENWVNFGAAFGLLKRYDETIEHLKKAEAIDPNLVWNLQGLAICYRQKEDYEQELPYRQRVAELEPEKAENWGMVGSTLVLLKRYDEAIEQYKKAEAIDPNLVWNLDGLADCYRQKEDYEQELLYRQRVAELEPNDAANWGMVGAAFGGLKRYDEAIEQRKKAELLDPNLVWNLQGLAWCYHEKEDYEQELPYRQRVAELEPEDAGNWTNLGVALGLLKCHDEALEQFKKAEAIDPNLVGNLGNLAICYHEKEDYEQELFYRQRVAEMEPNKAENLSALGSVLMFFNRYDEAIEQLKKAEAIDPNMVRNLQGLAWCYHQKKDYAQELPYRQRVAELEPENAENWCVLAQCHLQLQHRDEALLSIEKAIALAPDDVSTVHSAGWAYFVGGCVPEAKQYFLRSLGLADSEASAHMNLGHIALIEQNEPGALAYYQRSFELSADVPKLLEGYEDDYRYLAPHGVEREHYWRVVRQAQAAAE